MRFARNCTPIGQMISELFILTCVMALDGIYKSIEYDNVCIFTFSTNMSQLNSNEINFIANDIITKSLNKNIIYDFRKATLSIGVVYALLTNKQNELSSDVTANLDKKAAIVYSNHYIYTIVKAATQIYTFKTDMIVTTNYNVALDHCFFK